jgi:hypothetical protein
MIIFIYVLLCDFYLYFCKIKQIVMKTNLAAYNFNFRKYE